MNSQHHTYGTNRRNVIIVESDPTIAERLVASIAAQAARENGIGTTSPLIECTVLESKHDFFETDPATWDLVITASDLQDGFAFDVLSFVQGLRPDVPVIITGQPDDSNAAVEAIKAGASDYLVLTGHEMITFPVTVQKCLALQIMRAENDDLHAELSQSLAELAVANRELQQMIQRLEIAARTDDLTKLCNRRWLNLMLESRWEEATRNGIPLAFMMIDLDGFKSFNDLLGHQKGDEILRLAARVLDANCRSIDVSARFGGDEFCVLMPHASPDAALQIAHRIASAFDEAVSAIYEPDSHVSMSIGVSHWQLTNPVNADELVRHADEAMYSAKSVRSKRVVLSEKIGKTAA
ncbi:MAG: diguanylate cyclase [Phycisphaerales bacterium]|nr:diguanylate cyclase [Planctomycetota bacterium]MBL6997867.1 diguanylate cyclase [Phycisphaerales bacterium]